MTAVAAVRLPGPVTLVPSKQLEDKLAEQADNPVVPQDPVRILADLNARTDGVPATVSPPRGNFGAGLRLYGPGYVIWLYSSRHGDSYTVTGVYPMRGAEHALLAEGYLSVQPAAWRWAHELRAVPPGSDSGWSRIEKAWEKLGASDSGRSALVGLPERHRGFLDNLDELIDAVEDLTAKKQQNAAGIPYREVVATGGRREGMRSVYEFRLAGGQVPEANAFVQVDGAVPRRGQVTRVDGGTATVRFDEPVGWSELSHQGVLQPTPNRTVYRRQREAVDRLRTNKSAGPELLSVLADHRTATYHQSAALPADDLDPDQLAAFQRALTVPDMLAVLGPPGTGKTRTITEITRACAQTSPPQRVLVTSHTHRAVDNVLARLPRELVVIRVGHEDRVTADGQPYLLARQASDLRQEIVGASTQRIARFGGLEVAEQWLGELRPRAEALLAGAHRALADKAAWDTALRTADKAASTRHEQASARVSVIDAEIAENKANAKRLAQRAERSRLAFLARRRSAKLDQVRARGSALLEERKALAAELTAIDAGRAARWPDEPDIAAAAAAFVESRETCAKLIANALDASRYVHAAVTPVAEGLDCPPLPEASGALDAPAIQRISCWIGQFADWAESALPTLDARLRLLREWHDEAADKPDQLYPELIRYADVVAATCSGTAEVEELGDIELDLAIIDEAGQIGLPDALVPLVRAKRAVLVGDDRQLPPVVSHDVKEWGEEKADAAVLPLLTKSALEHLIEGMPPTNIVQLTRQRRMPTDVCDFISAQFYRGVLKTAVERPHHDPLFRRPMAFVETSHLPVAQRRESSGGTPENWNMPGRSNQAEAEILAELAAFYHGRGAEWAVIVPYRAQVALVTGKVATRIRDIESARNNIGTVDSFQGGERDVILYGFTRSNARGAVGFLSELRRINVALSRVRRQLVMVGDANTLETADDPGFRALAHALRDHLRRHGEVREYSEVMGRLRELHDEGSGA